MTVAGEPGTIDAHVHLHPDGLGSAIRAHFARERWLVAHSFDPAAVAATLAARGVERFCFFSYTHKPGMARALNRWVAETAARLPQAIALGALHAGDPDLEDVVAEAVDRLGLRGFKLHLSVQRFSADDPRLVPVYERAESEGLVLMVHAGTMPYRDPHTGVAAFRRVMERHPRLRACVAHMGCHESDDFLALTGRYPNLYVDTTMALAPSARPYVGADPERITDAAILRHQDKILFGSDFPLIPYDYEEERRWAADRGLPAEVRRKIFRDNALQFFGPVAAAGG